ncbi:phospholipase D-like domain-containing protein [Variovorax fucosicus]|uniref:phospholipase D-like domain-containing protein n=1 Tax=Variovorax fucosicus TaxID=3053517 RepID=UPI002577CEEC|nr:phospholipase D family protein [Variovorax sp. J22G47]MDM0056439.1 phospholipase D family protein [Variovorax sp. J22G47]
MNSPALRIPSSGISSTRLVWRLLVLALVSLLTACVSLPPRGEVSSSLALADTADTSLAQVAASSRPPGEAQPSGFRLLPLGEFAFDARVALSRQAERSLDLQYYYIHRDEAGRTLLRELRDAAQRGVRVRLLVDDFYAAQINDLLIGLASFANVEVRLFNPMPLRRGAPVFRLVLSPGDFQLYNHRMHNKLFVADNAMAIYGGRNIADEYFMKNREANFIDSDVLSTGRVVTDLSTAFDRYWNSELAWPVQTLLGKPTDAAAARLHFDREVDNARVAAPQVPTDPFGQSTVGAQLHEGRLMLSYAAAQVHADPPEKASDTTFATEPAQAVSGLLAALTAARQEVVMVSPYFVPGEVGMPLIRKARENGIRIMLFTNSLGSTDEPLVHDRYAAYRVEMLRLGVELYEVSPTQTRRLRRFGDFGRSLPRLHAKVAIVDRQRLLVGSANLDARSAVGNTELSVVIDSPVLAEVFASGIDGDNFASVYKLRLKPDGQTIEWIHFDEQDQTNATTDEPDSGRWLRLKLWLLSLLVDERDL